MKIIITEQQFNIILFERSKKSSEEINDKYDALVKKYNDIYNETGELIRNEINNVINPDYTWLVTNKKLREFYIDTNHEQKLEKIKKEKYDRLVKKYNDLYNETGEFIKHYDSDVTNPDYSWLRKNKKLDSFYIDTNYEKNLEQIKKDKYNALVKKYNDLYNETGELIRDEINDGKNPDYAWLFRHNLITQFRIDTNHEQKLEKIKKEKYDRLIEKYDGLVEKYKNTDETIIIGGPEYVWLSRNNKLKDFYREIGGIKKNESIGEKLIKKWLENKGLVKDVDFVQQHEFCDLKNINCLKIDFYLPEYNLAIEFDGRQHFKPIKRSKNDNDEIILNRFKKTEYNDKLKNEYCEGKINLYRIKHDDQSSISKKVLDEKMSIIFNDIESGNSYYEFNKSGIYI
jgi:very-short-patch-repair endonuclease